MATAVGLFPWPSIGYLFAPVRPRPTTAGAAVAVLRGHTGQVWALAVAPGGARLISGAADHTVRIWQAEGGVRASPSDSSSLHAAIKPSLANAGY